MRGTDLPAPGQQQPCHIHHQFRRHVEHDTIGDHAEPSPEKTIFSETSSTGGLRVYMRTQHPIRVSTGTPSSYLVTGQVPEVGVVDQLGVGGGIHG